MVGVLNIDKPEGITSHDAVDHVRRLTGERRVGHGGTLDPFATGVLLVAIGPATRLLEYTKELQKTYRAIFTLGASSDTDDGTGIISAGPVTADPPTSPLSSGLPTPSAWAPPEITRSGPPTAVPPAGEIREALQSFIGSIEQIPPAYSAVKIDGKKLYELARAGKPTAAKPRRVTVYDIKLLRYEYPELELEITCGGGTYVRAIARDLGKMLGVGGYAQELRRLAIGEFTAEDSVTLTALTKETIDDRLLPPKTLVAHLPRVELTASQIKDFQQGKTIAITESKHSPTGPLAVFSADQLIGIGSMIDSELQPDKVLIV